jgi:hypothetical protein
MARVRQLAEREREIIGAYAARHGAVFAFEEVQVADARGGIGAPLVRLSVLAKLERKGVIGRMEADAGERFHALFQRGALDTLRASDLSRVSGTATQSSLPPAGERCRQRVAEAMVALGGAGSVAASAVWHVVGLEWPVHRWAHTVQRHHTQACGILVGALAVLAAHFAGRRG